MLTDWGSKGNKLESNHSDRIKMPVIPMFTYLTVLYNSSIKTLTN
jgi:hypothetical protein